jgi:hypothetical protein
MKEMAQLTLVMLQASRAKDSGGQGQMEQFLSDRSLQGLARKNSIVQKLLKNYQLFMLIDHTL